jgi:TP901 family phage tail tape measure protein
MNIGAMWATLGIDVSELKKAQQEFAQSVQAIGKEVESVQKKMDKLGARMKTFGGDATRSLTVPLSIIGGMGANAFQEFELTMAHIQGLTGQTADQIRAWTTELKQMAPNIGKNPQELAEALYFIASSGIKASEAMDVLTVSARASVAGLGSTQQVADLATSAMNAYVKQGLQAGEVTDILTAAVREGKIEANAFAEHIGYVIPVAAEMGVSFDQVAAAMAAMSTTGADASTSATQLRQLLSDILKPAMQSEKALKEFGLSGYKLRKILQEDGLLAALGTMRDLITKFGKDAVAKVFPEVRALTGVLMLIGQNSEHVSEIFQKVKNSSGDMQKAFEVVTQTLDYKYNVSISQAKLSLISLGQALKGPLISLFNSFADSLKNVTAWFESLTQGQKEFILYFSGAMALIGPATYAIGSLIGVMSGLATTIKTVGIAIASNPLWLLAGVVTAGSVALIRHITAVDSTTAAYRKLNADLGIESFKLNDVFSKLKTTSEGTTQRAEAIRIINSRYGVYLSNLLTEKSSLQDIEKAQKEASKAMVANISVKNYKAQLEENIGAISQSFDKEFATFLEGFRRTYGSDRIGEFIDNIFKNADLAVKTNSKDWSLIGKYAQNAYDQYYEAIAKFSKLSEGQIGRTQFLNSFINFVTVKRQKSPIIDQLEALTKSFEKMAGVGETGFTIDPFKSNDKAGLTDIQKIMQKVADGEELIAEKTKIMGKEFKTNEELLRVYENALDQLIELHLSPLDKNLVEITNKWKGTHTSMIKPMMDLIPFAIQLGQAFAFIGTNIGGTLGETKKLSNLQQDVTGELAYVQFQASLLGDTYDLLGAETDIYANAIEKLYKDGYRPGNKALDDYIEKLQSLRKEQEQTIMSAQAMQDVYQFMGNAGVEAFTTIGKSMAGQKDAWDSFVDSTLNGLQQIISALLAQAIVGVLAGEAPKGLAGLITGAVGVGLLLGMWDNYKSKASSVSKMAEGGIIPAGYPNDTYPALLSSNEVVIPPDKLNNLVAPSFDSSKIVFEIEGYKLVGMVKKEMKRQSLM